MNPIHKAFAGILNPGVDSQQIGELAAMLDLPISELLTLSNNRRICYRTFTVGKRGGGLRSIAAPSGYLKQLQRRLLQNYLETLPVHPLACAYRRGYSIVAHARMHLNQQIVVSGDLKDFFSRTSTRRVRNFYASYGWRDEALRILVRLSEFRGGLPQGAPTSPALSNVINFEMDSALHELAMMNGAQYSRYADDLAFSWSSRTVEPMTFRSSVEGLLERYEYQIQPEKGWKLQHAKEQPELTGIAISGSRLRPCKKLRDERNRLRWTWAKTKYQQAKLAGLNGFAKQLRRWF